MLPEIASNAIAALTQPGDLVFDPLCGAGTTLIEALYLGRSGVGIDIDPRWASAARDNITHAYRHGVGRYGHVLTADAHRLPEGLPPEYLQQLRGRVSLLLTAWPAGPPYHSHPRSGANLTHQPPRRVAAGMATILRGALPLMAPNSHIVITGRAWREHGDLVDLATTITDTVVRAGMLPVQRCVALLAGIRDNELVTRTSRYHRRAATRARAAGNRWHLPCVQEVLVARPPHTFAPPSPADDRRSAFTPHNTPNAQDSEVWR
jgi:SAM-dependent methyltransferase